jgi:hypothetical protein
MPVMRRRCLFNEKAGVVNKAAKKTSNRNSGNITTPRCKSSSGDNNSKPMRTPPCALPGIGLHLNALTTVPKEKIVPHPAQPSINQASNFPCAVSSSPPTSEPNTAIEDSSQAIVVGNADEPGQAGPKKKRYDFYVHYVG